MKALFIVSFILFTVPVYAVEYSPLPEPLAFGKHTMADMPFNLDTLKPLWKKRISAIKADGVLPIIDIESSFNPGKVDAKQYALTMDDNGIALTAFSPQIGKKKYRKKATLWHNGARRAVGADPYRYIPASTAGIYPAWTEKPEAFLKKTMQMVAEGKYPLMGEFEFRHYMSPRQYRRDEQYRDVSIPIDSSAGHALFAFSQRTGISFQIHYEVEDVLLPTLAKMLTKYPKARVIWCHLAQVRYVGRAKNYGPAYIRRLIQEHPNIYFDLAFGGADSVYPGSGEYHATIWDRSNGGVKQVWIDLITDHPYRFLAALDIGGDRLHHVERKVEKLRYFIGHFSDKVQEIVAYKAAWKLLFNEDI